MEITFKNELKKQLRDHVKGYLSVHIINDMLIVDIQTLDHLSWHYAINILAVQTPKILSSRIVADVIIKEYKKYILSQYFYTK